MGQNSNLTFSINSEEIRIGGMVVKMNDATGLVLDEVKENKDRKYSLYSYPRMKKTFKSLQRYVERR